MNTATKNLFFACSVVAIGTSAFAVDQAPVPSIPAPPGLAVAATNDGPRIKFQTTAPNVGKLKGTEPVKYTFIFTNTGTQPLEITSVVPHCGCTVSGEWTKRVEPGQSGTIPIQVNVAPNWPSAPFTKTVTVNCNDTSQPPVTLSITGTIWKPIEAPQFVQLNVPPDSTAGVASVVRIINNMDEPVTLSAPESNNKAFTAQIKTNQPGKEFDLVVSAVPPLSPGSVQGQITIKTSSTNMPVLSISVFANVQPAIGIYPAQVTLPAGPLAAQITPSVMIQNNGTNALTLSEPMVNGKAVPVQLKEMQPGRSFNATLSFPQGFEISQGEQVVLSIKSSHPQYPVIKVPIIQTPRPPQPIAPVKLPPPPAAANAVPTPVPATASSHPGS